MNGLDLYAKVEHLFDFEDVMQFLWDKYIQELKQLGVKKVLDIGCGSGGFMLQAQKEGFEVVGVDISKKMIENAKQKDLLVYHMDLCEFTGKFDACVAIFDVLNYMDKEYLEKFFYCVKNVLNDGGYFLFDINTFYGFDEIAQGTLSVEDDKYFVVLNSIFQNNTMNTKIDLFYKNGDLYKRDIGNIIQYFYCDDYFDKIGVLKPFRKLPINLYGEEADKTLIIMKN